jgi:uncharacterized protein (DUF486 family)
MKALYTIGLLLMSNIFMTVAWYGNLKLTAAKSGNPWPLILIIVVSWGVAFLEYCFMIPANRIGFAGNGGPFSLIQLKIIQEVISLTVFSVFVLLVFRTETFRMNHVISFLCLIAAVYFAFRK